MDSEQQVCPVCGQPVDMVVRRHKTLGAWVPVWSPGPCHSPDCASRPDLARPAGAPARPRSSGPGGPAAV
ncbi:hypothetical protein D9753_11835 [Streptomyces dangxiongensis]|uniref:Uncharacterized protein n=1 Tax=Streptomyces dangxiongensis TaxID=1442032 RepID=A0A3G2JDP0_9ACTN|nr:hypothetical protein [Streptomyces dangxiongensis]AYN39495.1 hypothetical protein D9753_11835 [Streptomyces dangxiongensis]